MALGKRLISTAVSGPPVVGDIYEGGVVFWVNPSDPNSGMLASLVNIGSSLTWNNGSSFTTGATGTAVGTGGSNTTTIINAQGNFGSYAARNCRLHNGGGFNNWFLPSSDELAIMRGQQGVIAAASGNGFVQNQTWSSTEVDAGSAIVRLFQNPNIQGPQTKFQPLPVRAARYYTWS